MDIAQLTERLVAVSYTHLVWTDSDKLKLWLMCLMKATHEGKTQVVGNQIIELKPGDVYKRQTNDDATK